MSLSRFATVFSHSAVLATILLAGPVAQARVPAGDISELGQTCRSIQDRIDALLHEYWVTGGGATRERNAEILAELTARYSDWRQVCEGAYGEPVRSEEVPKYATEGLLYTGPSSLDGTLGYPGLPDVGMGDLGMSPDPSVVLAITDLRAGLVELAAKEVDTTIRCDTLDWEASVCDRLTSDEEVATTACDAGISPCGKDLYLACDGLAASERAMACDGGK